MFVEENSKTRSLLFDNMKGFLIILVVFAHFINLEEYIFRFSKLVYTYIYFFHMPAFIFVTGYFSKNVEKCRRDAVKKYAIPYLILTITSYLHVMIVNGGITYSLKIFTSTTGCWFLFVLFIYRIFLRDIVDMKFTLLFSLVIGIVSGLSHEFSLAFSMQRMMTFLFFFILGYYTTELHIEKIRKMPKLLGISIIILVLMLSIYCIQEPNFKVTLLHGKKYYRDDLLFYDMFIRIMLYVAGSAMIVALINLMSDKKCFLDKLGKNSLGVYMLHLFIMRRFDWILNQYDIKFSNGVVYTLFIFCISIIVSYVCSRTVFVRIIKRSIDAVNNLIFKHS